ncbi:hypothetical protein AAGX61_13520, partial [Staphylococcus aureus]
FRQIQTFSLRQAIFLCVNFYFDVLDIKKETLRSQCGSSHPFLAWQRSTLAERKLKRLIVL